MPFSSDENKKQTFQTLKKLGWATVLFFIVKGTISTILILWAGQSLFEGCAGK